MVEGYHGRPGAGKTAAMVAAAWALKKRGRAVFANIPLIDRREKASREFWFFGKLSIRPQDERTYGKPWADGFLTCLDDALKLDNALVLVDEVHMWMPSTAWQAIEFDVRRYLAQQRKWGLDIWWTAQSNAQVFNEIRRLTATLWSCERWGRLSVLKGSDPDNKADLGKKYLYLTPDIWNLYDTEYVVGDRKGETAGTYGKNLRYHREVKPVRQLRRYSHPQTGWVGYRWADEMDGQEETENTEAPEPLAKVPTPVLRASSLEPDANGIYTSNGQRANGCLQLR